MTDETEAAPATEAADEVVQTEVEQAEAAEAPESTEGQEQDPPADADKAEEKSEAAKRRERRKAREREMREENENLKREVERIEASKARIAEAAKASQPPKEKDFADYNEYLMAVGAFNAEKLLNARETREIEQQSAEAESRRKALEQQEAQEAAREWAAQIEEARTRYADFDKVALGQHYRVTPEMAKIIQRSDMSADVAYYLGSNPMRSAEIAQMSALDAAREIGRIEARISMPRPKVESNTPEPIKAVRGKATAALNPEKMSMDEYRKARAEGKI